MIIFSPFTLILLNFCTNIQALVNLENHHRHQSSLEISTNLDVVAKPRRYEPTPKCQPISVEQCKDLPYSDTRYCAFSSPFNNFLNFYFHFMAQSQSQLICCSLLELLKFYSTVLGKTCLSKI